MSNKSLSNSIIYALNNTISDDEKLKILSELKGCDFSSSATYDKLEHLILNHNNNDLRYQVLKLIYQFFPKAGKKLIRWSLLNDPNYNVKIINLIDSTPQNFNFIIEEALQQKYNRELLVNDVIDNEFLQVILFWKDCNNQFHVFYDIVLKCFIFRNIENDNLSFLCRKIIDPFETIPSVRTYELIDFLKLKGVKTQKFFCLKIPSSIELVKETTMQISLESLRRNLNFYQSLTGIPQNKIEFSILREESSNLPNFKLYTNSHNFVLYCS